MSVLDSLLMLGCEWAILGALIYLRHGQRRLWWMFWRGVGALLPFGAAESARAETKLAAIERRQDEIFGEHSLSRANAVRAAAMDASALQNAIYEANRTQDRVNPYANALGRNSSATYFGARGGAGGSYSNALNIAGVNRIDVMFGCKVYRP